MLYLDTSVLVAALTREPRTADMQAWLGAQEAGTLCISDWTVTEFSSALSMKVRMEILTAHERADVLSAFASSGGGIAPFSPAMSSGRGNPWSM